MAAMIPMLFRMHHETGETEMTDAEYARKLDELDRLLNDPDVPMEPAKVWSLLAEIAQRDLALEHRGQETA
jgi:hypothetical protein